MEDLKISHVQIGLIGTFFLAFYSVAQFPVGYLSDIVGPRKIIIIGGVTSAVANVFFSAGTSLFYLIGFQGLNGLGQGGGWVPGVKLLNNWFPKSERGRTLGLFGTCESIFIVFAYILAVYLGKMFGWRVVFRILPMILLFVLFVYWVVVDDHPDRISAQNFRYRTPEPGEKSSENRYKLIVILSNKNVRMTCIGFFCLMYISYCNLIWLPAYLYESYGLSVVKAGF
jgi:sugar phosphate permease